MTTLQTTLANGFSMDFVQFGRGKDVLVILPGLSVQSVMRSADVIEHAYRLLADHFTIYMFDRRNDLPSTYSMHEMATDTVAAFESIGIERASIFGASQGGMIAMQIAIDRPDIVDSLVLGSTSACMTEKRYQLIEKWIRLAKAGDAEGLYLSFGEAIFPPDEFERSRDAFKLVAKTVMKEDLDRFVTLASCLKGFNVTQDLANIICPVLVMGDESDKVLGADASRLIVEALGDRPDVELHLYDGYGHAVYDLAPDYKERMLRFLTATR